MPEDTALADTTAVEITVEGVTLHADVARPSGPVCGTVLFAHGSGSSRLSPRNRAVAATLVRAGLATVLLDLLSEDEELVDRQTREFRFDIPLLADRLAGATDWLREQPVLGSVGLGYFGASTGSAAALIAAARRPHDVAAVVSRGGRADLAGGALAQVRAPTLLVVGGADHEVLALNRQAARRMSAPVEIKVVPGATHLFEERGALQAVSELARSWFLRYLCATNGPSPGGDGWRNPATLQALLHRR